MDQTPENLADPIVTVRHPSRRALLRGAAVGAAGAVGVTAVGAGVLSVLPRSIAHAAAGSSKCIDSVQTILNIAATAEQLAVTFYSNGIANAKALGISGVNLDYLKAAVVEEQLHENLLVAAGGKSLTSTFSFPGAGKTFTNLGTFIITLNQLESDFESAYLIAISELAQQNQPGLAVLAGQIATIEAEHRVIGRSIETSIKVPNDRGFTPVLVGSVGEAVTALTDQGYLSPKQGNSYSYSAVSTKDGSVFWREPFVQKC
jgi:hypothetical protein